MRHWIVWRRCKRDLLEVKEMKNGCGVKKEERVEKKAEETG